MIEIVHVYPYIVPLILGVLKNNFHMDLLAKVSKLYFDENHKPGNKTASAIVKGIKFFIPLDGLVDFSEEISRIKKEIKKLEKDFVKTEGKLNNEKFLSKAAPKAIEKEKKKFAEMKEKIEHLNKRLSEIEQW